MLRADLSFLNLLPQTALLIKLASMGLHVMHAHAYSCTACISLLKQRSELNPFPYPEHITLLPSNRASSPASRVRGHTPDQ